MAGAGPTRLLTFLTPPFDPADECFD